MGVMIGYVAGAIIQILQYLSSAEQLKMFTLWSMGSLSHITVTQLGIMIPMLCIGLLISVACIKSLNLLLLGENYARTMGMNIKRSRMFIFVSTALLTGTVTAFCGPVDLSAWQYRMSHDCYSTMPTTGYWSPAPC